MEQRPSWEANRSSASQEFFCILWNPKVHYRIHKSRVLVPILRWIDPVHSRHPTFQRSVLILSSHLCLGLPSGLLPSDFSTKTCMHFSCPPYVLHAIPSCKARGIETHRISRYIVEDAVILKGKLLNYYICFNVLENFASGMCEMLRHFPL